MSEEDWDNDDGYTATTTPAYNTHQKQYNSQSYSSYHVHNDHDDRDRQHSRGDRGYERRRDGPQQNTNYAFKEEIDIETDSVGRIIGKGGSTIKKLQTDYNVRANLDRARCCVTVQGNSRQDVEEAIYHIKERLLSSAPRSSGMKYDNGGRSYDTYSKSERVHDRDSNYGRRDNNDFYKSAPLPNRDTETGLIDWSALNKKAEEERTKRWAKCPPLTKDFYQENPEVATLSSEDVLRIRALNNNTTISRLFAENKESGDIPNPIWKFEQCFAGYPDLLAEIYKQEFTKPSPIQAQAWPVLLRGEDLIGIAQTGTGKTLAFLLPAMIHTEFQSVPRSERVGPNVLIMAPTRELALQIEKEVNKYSFRGMKAVCVYGGGNRREQISNVESGTEIIICTPGRLNDLIQANVIDVASITYLVLDEADRMLDMGFEPQIRKILLDIRPDRQTVMTSATWPIGVRRLAQSYMHNPIQVSVGSLDLAATHSVKQIVEFLGDDDKYFYIKSFIKRMQPKDKIIIFCGRKTRADDLSSDLTLDGFLVQCIHGSREQSDREQAIADISTGEVRILIATDVASRGLDIEDITHVINFDFPRNIEEYVHRVGRTGRAGRTGTSISLLTRTDWGMARELIDIMEEAGQEVPDELRNMASRFKAMKDRKNDEMTQFKGFRGASNRRDRY